MPRPFQWVGSALVLPPLVRTDPRRGDPRRRPRSFWRLVDESLWTIRLMHQHGVVHLDLDPEKLIYTNFEPPRATFALPGVAFTPTRGHDADLLRAYDAMRLIEGLAGTRVGQRRFARDPNWLTLLLRRNLDTDALARVPDLDADWLPNLLGRSAPYGLPVAIRSVGLPYVRENAAERATRTRGTLRDPLGLGASAPTLATG